MRAYSADLRRRVLAACDAGGGTPGGWVGPHRFAADFGHLPSARVVSEG